MTTTLKSLSLSAVFLVSLSSLPSAARAQHLRWHPSPTAKPATVLYGEIEVLSTNKYIYYCGCNWWPGNPAGGYTGIQDQGGGKHNMIFSIWDTTPSLHPSIPEMDKRTQGSRFGGEGTGAHTHLDYDWKLGEVYQYYAEKVQDAKSENTLTKLYFYDAKLRKWVHEATISNPNNGNISVPTFGGSLNAFLENWMGEEREKPKLARYRLWTGTKPSDLQPVTEGSGDGNWGVLNDAFYLAEGEESAVGTLIEKLQKGPKSFTRGEVNKGRLMVTSHKLPRHVIKDLEHLSH